MTDIRIDAETLTQIPVKITPSMTQAEGEPAVMAVDTKEAAFMLEGVAVDRLETLIALLWQGFSDLTERLRRLEFEQASVLEQSEGMIRAINSTQTRNAELAEMNEIKHDPQLLKNLEEDATSEEDTDKPVRKASRKAAK